MTADEVGTRNIIYKIYTIWVYDFLKILRLIQLLVMHRYIILFV